MTDKERIEELEVALGNLLDFVEGMEGDCMGSEQTGRYWSGKAWDLFVHSRKVLIGESK